MVKKYGIKSGAAIKYFICGSVYLFLLFFLVTSLQNGILGIGLAFLVALLCSGGLWKCLDLIGLESATKVETAKKTYFIKKSHLQFILCFLVFHISAGALMYFMVLVAMSCDDASLDYPSPSYCVFSKIEPASLGVMFDVAACATPIIFIVLTWFLVKWLVPEHPKYKK